MNERIRELMIQAADPEHGFIIPEVFAELIVRECAAIDWRSRLPILQHFGVEE